MGSYYCKMYIGNRCQRVFGGTKGFVNHILDNYGNDPSSILPCIQNKGNVSNDKPVYSVARFYCYKKNSRSKSKKLKKTLIVEYRLTRDFESEIHATIQDRYVYDYDNRTVSSVEWVNMLRQTPPVKRHLSSKSVIDGQLFGNVNDFDDSSMYPIRASDMGPIKTSVVPRGNSSRPQSTLMKIDNRTSDLPLKVFLSHPMTGLTDNEVNEIRTNAISELKKCYGEIEVIDNYNHENVPPNAGRLWHLGASIQQMEQADGVYFCGDWNSAPGCAVERMICRRYKIPVLNDGIILYGE